MHYHTVGAERKKLQINCSERNRETKGKPDIYFGLSCLDLVGSGPPWS